ncbi:MAG TPA: NADH-quinone oxidoreductase subunit J [Acidimicrobiales bacterium]|nr:NADH-quinone oxidoreductase subunit J [Acidimicrobiales bacterium]
MDSVWGDQVAQQVAFFAIAAVMVVAALRVVTSRNVVHAALYLVVVLTGMAGQFLLLGAEFLAATQLLVYVGAIIVLFLFGIMLTRAQIGKDPDVDNTAAQRWSGGLVAVILLVIMGYAIYDAFDQVALPTERVQPLWAVSDAIFSTYIVPFEAISVLLLAALIGAIVVARKD